MNYVVVAATGTCSSCTAAEIEAERNLTIPEVSERVTCQQMKRAIGADMCRTMQDPKACRNCPAPSRICENCGNRAVRFPQYGLCFTCTIAEFGEGWKGDVDPPEVHLLQVLREIAAGKTPITLQIKYITQVFAERFGKEYTTTITGRWISEVIEQRLGLDISKSLGQPTVFLADMSGIDILQARQRRPIDPGADGVVTSEGEGAMPGSQEPVPLAASADGSGESDEQPAAGVDKVVLNKRQLEVLDCVERNLDNAAIATELGIEETSVRNRMTGLYELFGLKNMAVGRKNKRRLLAMHYRAYKEGVITSTAPPTVTEDVTDKDEVDYQRARALVIERQEATYPLLQRTLRLGQNRITVILKRLEEEGVVSKPDSPPKGTRRVLVPPDPDAPPVVAPYARGTSSQNSDRLGRGQKFSTGEKIRRLQQLLVATGGEGEFAQMLLEIIRDLEYLREVRAALELLNKE